MQYKVQSIPFKSTNLDGRSGPFTSVFFILFNPKNFVIVGLFKECVLKCLSMKSFY